MIKIPDGADRPTRGILDVEFPRTLLDGCQLKLSCIEIPRNRSLTRFSTGGVADGSFRHRREANHFEPTMMGRFFVRRGE